MADKDIIKKVIDILPLLNTAIKNIRLYPPTSVSVSGPVERLHHSLSKLLDEEEAIFFTESEKSLLICGKALMQKDQEKFLTLALLNVLLGLGIRSISFRRELQKDELCRFIGLLARNPDSIQNEGGIAKLMTDLDIVHAAVDQKVYVAMDKGRQVLAHIDNTNDQVTRFFMLSQPDLDPQSPQFGEMVNNPSAMSKAFEAGLSKIMAQKGSLADDQLSANLDNLLSLLDDVAEGLDNKNRDILSQQIGQALMTADRAMAEQMTTRNIKPLLGGHLYQYLMEELTQNKLDAARNAAAPAESQSKLLQIAEKFGLKLQEPKTVLDEGLMAYLPKIVEQLVAQKHQEAMEKLLARLAANLSSDNTDVRIRAARSLADIFERLPGEIRSKVIERLSDRLIAWLKNENVFSNEYQRIFVILKNVTQDYMTEKQFAKALQHLDAFNAVANGANKKTDAAKKLSLDVIGQLAGPENIDILLSEINTPNNSHQEDARRLLAALGSNAVDDLLDLLMTNDISNERVRIMHLIASLKAKALPLITARITKEAPWFYLRNLAYLLGQIGNEESARALAPLLSHVNDKLRQEALKSIYRTGGDQRGSILLEALPLADDEFKSGIVEVLGQSKATEAVPLLIEMLKNKPLLTTAARTNLEEKICTALGAIGSPDAIAPLAEITAAKSFLSLRAYPEKVKAAAARSLVTLKRKVAGSGAAAV